ncbi:MAG TPA: hypothetical protein ENK91_06805 [Bacteroidetes bacterium]|nr:hypothetical protein [Bacteroidota bacterium]
MKFSVYTYYLLILSIFTGIVLMKDLMLGGEFVYFLIINIVVLKLAKGIYKVPVFFFLGTIFLSYFLRGFVIYFDFSSFTMYKVYPVSKEISLKIFDDVLIAVSLFSIGYLIASVKYSKYRKKGLDNNYSQAFLSSFGTIMLLLTGLLVLKLGLYYGLGIGRKGFENNGSVGFLLRLIPLDLPFVISVLFAFKYFDRLSIGQKMVLLVLTFGFSYSVLITGSKSFLMIFAVAYLVYLLYSGQKIGLLAFSILLLIGVVLTGFSFAISRAMKYSFVFKDFTTIDIINLSLKILKEEGLPEILKNVTIRFNGFDGQLKYFGMVDSFNELHLHRLEQIFSIKEIGLRIVEGVVPKLELTSTVTCGRGVGMYAEGVPASKIYAGALGILASVALMGKGALYGLMFFLGIFVGYVFKLIGYIKNPDLKFIFFFFFIFFTMNLAMSGNFDALLIQLIIKLAVLVFGVFLVFFVKSTLLKSPKGI